ncbi:MAG: peptidylprolyl isomerase [Vulcanococcus sp.]
MVVLCRRWVDWLSAEARGEQSQFALTYPIQPMLEQWLLCNPGTTFQSYRQQLHQIAAASWQSGGATVLHNPVAMERDAQLAAPLLAKCREADWVIPIDDDDWLSPHLPSQLLALQASSTARLAIWDVLPVHVDADHCFAEAPRAFLNPDASLTERVAFSCGYALSRALMADLSDLQLAGCLLHHSDVTSLLGQEGAAVVLPDVQAVNLRHPATAGSLLEPGRERRLFAFPAPAEMVAVAPWVLQPLQAMQILHANGAALAAAALHQGPEPEPTEAWVELPLGQPRIRLDDFHQLLDSQGLDRLLAQAIVLNEIEQAVALPQERVDQLRAERLQDWLDDHDGVRPTEVHEKAELERQVRLELRQARLRHFEEICFGDGVELRYLERKADLDQVVYSVIQVQEQGLAEEIYHQIREGEAQFGDLAVIHTLGREAQSRGQIGPEPMGRQHPELVSRLRSGSTGQLWPPFEAEGVWVVLRLEHAALMPLDGQVREQLLDELMQEWMDERIRILLSGEPLPALPFPQVKA